ncbi:Cysteine-rich CWC [Evansella caseinilytica]|uniref:Cysteine-rich CWC n=1 Tax=Evansella caseinilytica TaxID=1503961 RepID=A0A1H3GS38_9BACI|nr:cysteine-rich CWC family protein [Evansella caseinilytica]SDY05294.1 Cysteine-rich CWC [Evansella caseinilytica]
MEHKKTTGKCPICGKKNHCGYGGDCWCNGEVFPAEIFRLVPAEHLGKSCICKACLAWFKESQRCET